MLDDIIEMCNINEDTVNTLAFIAILINFCTVLYLRYYYYQIDDESTSQKPNMTLSLVCSLVSLVLIIPSLVSLVNECLLDEAKKKTKLIGPIILCIIILLPFLLLLLYIFLDWCDSDNPYLNILWGAITLINNIIIIIILIMMYSKSSTSIGIPL